MYSLGTRGLHGHHSRSLGIVTPPAADYPKAPLPAPTAFDEAVAAAGGPARTVAIRTLQQAMVVRFGAQAMRHSCGSGTCDGRWGSGTERLLDQVFANLRIGPDEQFEVRGANVLLPGQVASWAETMAAQYTAGAGTVAPPSSLTEAMIPEGEEPYESQRRRRGPNIALIVGGSAAAVGVLALGFVLWKKRGKR